MTYDILHGFLGRACDWDWFQGAKCWDLFSESSIDCDSLTSWGKWFATASNSDVLVGYSLGGRLALHALFEAPEKWRGVVMISTHPGLETVMERQMRLEHDLAWAQRWVADPWDRVVRDWNDQMVFTHDLKPDVSETDFDREKLYRAMVNWSLGHQEDLRSKIAKLNVPILWIVGEFDKKFRKLAESVTLSNAKSKFWIAPQVGHRVHLSQEKSLVNRILEFEESL